MRRSAITVLLLSVMLLGFSAQTKAVPNPFIGTWVLADQSAGGHPEKIIITEGLSGIVIYPGDYPPIGAYLLNGALITSGHLVSVIDSNGRLIFMSGDGIYTKQKK